MGVYLGGTLRDGGGSSSPSEGQGQQLHLFFTFDLSWWSSSARPSELPLVAVVI